jgi:hypothetical protein
VTITVTDLPPGITPSFTSVRDDQVILQTLVVRVEPTVAPATYTFVVRARADGGAERSASVAITVPAPASAPGS